MKRVFALLLCLVIAMTTLASCGGGVSLEDEDKGDIFYAYITDDIYAFDPGKDLTDASAVKILGLIYEGLFRLDENGKPVNALAEDVTILENEAKGEYKMQISIKKTKWSDGRALTADDFVFAWKRLMECTYQSTAATLLYDVKNARTVKAGDASIDDLGVVALDTYLLEITFEGKIDYENFKKNLASLSLVPLREESVANNDRYWSRRHATLVTNGPLVIKSIDRDENTMRIERNNYYYRDTEEDMLDRYVKPYRILVTFLKEEEKPSGQRTYADDLDAIYAAYAAGDLQYMGDVPMANRAALKKKANVTDANSTYTYMFNTENKLFADARVRRALSMALDREAIADLLVYAKPATGLVAETVYNATSGKSFRKVQGSSLQTTADVEGAKALLADAGVKKGSFTISYRQNDAETAVAEYVKGVWESLGFTVELNPLTTIRETAMENSEEIKYFIDSVQQAYETGEFDVLAVDVSMLGTDAFAPLAAYATEFSGNGIDMTDPNYAFIPHVTGFSDAAYDEIIERAFAEKDIAKRATILAEAERYLMEQAPVVPLVFNQDCYLISKDLKGVASSYLGFRIFTKADYTKYKFVPETDEAGTAAE